MHLCTFLCTCSCISLAGETGVSAAAQHPSWVWHEGGGGGLPEAGQEMKIRIRKLALYETYKVIPQVRDEHLLLKPNQLVWLGATYQQVHQVLLNIFNINSAININTGRSPQNGTMISGGCQSKVTSFWWLFWPLWDDQKSLLTKSITTGLIQFPKKKYTSSKFCPSH